jgi:uncharacterized protein (TIGR03435 family)
VVRAQDAGAGTENKPQVMAKNVDPDWEVVTVRASDPNGTQYGFQAHGREVDLDRRTVEQMLVFGYGLHDRQLAGLPDWARHEEWDVKGVPDATGRLSIWQYKALVRKVLVERFSLKTHTEQREMVVFALTVAKDGAKVVRNAAGPDGERDESEEWNGGQVTMHGVNMSMAELAQWMNFAADKPVIDRTGLAGGYDMGLRWTVDELKSPAAANGPPGFLTAVEEQLGLKLEPVKAPADVLVIDKVERPAAN